MIKTIVVKLVLASFLLYACANIKQPTGGPEDLKAPVIEECIPLNNSINYKEKIIVLKFDEYVDGQKLRENMIISPIIEGPIDIVTKKKTVTIKFKEDLKENTTYSINFGESIKDVTKGNFVKNMSLAFSTGPMIDSLRIEGNVIDYITEKGVKDISIQLYRDGDTNNILNSKPLYFAKTTEKGLFKIQNIKEGTYSIYALNDGNKDFKYTANKEAVAFVKNFTINKDTSNITLKLTSPDNKGPDIVSRKQEMDYYLIAFNKGLKKYVINSSIKICSEQSKDVKKLKLFSYNQTKDSIELFLTTTDSSNNTAIDTLKFKLEEETKKGKRTVFSLTNKYDKLELLKKDTITFVLNKPVKTISKEIITVKADTTLIEKDKINFQLDSNYLTINYTNPPNFKDSLSIRFPKGSIMSYSADSLKEQKLKYSIKNPENYGILAGKINCKDSSYIFQLLTENGQLIDTKYNIKEFRYEYLEPKAYKLRLILDKNNNQKWDLADVETGIQPEPMYYYKDILRLRANWEFLDINFSIKE